MNAKMPSVTACTKSMSRHDLLVWLNSACTSGQKIAKIEDLSSGISYCLITERLFPGSVQTKKLKMNPKMDYESLQNFKILQIAFNKIGVNKSIPIDYLIKKRFQDNFEFLKWFKAFCDVNNLNDEFENRHTPQLKRARSLSNIPKKEISRLSSPNKRDIKKVNENTPKSTAILFLTDQLSARTKEFEKMKQDLDFYTKKINKIDEFIQEEEKKKECNKFLNKIKDIIYSVETTEGKEICV